MDKYIRNIKDEDLAIINRDGVFCIDCFNEKIDDPTFNLCDACGKHYD